MLMAKGLRRRRDQRGAAAVEVAIIAPLIGLLLAALIGGWRIGWARAQVAEAAAAGARAATIPVSAAAAHAQASTAISSDLATVGVHCQTLDTSIDTSAYALPVGTPGQVHVQVNCVLNLSDLLVPGLPGQLNINATASEPLDTFRERTP